MKGLENAIRNLNSLDTRMVPQASAWAINRVAQKAVSVATRQVAGNTVAGDNQVKGIPLKLVRQRVRVFKASPSGKMTARIRVNRGNLPAIMGDQQRQRYQVQLSLRQKYQQQLEQLRRDSEQKGTYNTDDYRKAEQALTESLNRQLNENRRYWQQLEVVQGNWKNGVLRAFQDFTVDADNTAGTAEQVFSSAFSNMGNGLATFVTTGKLNFKSFTSSVLSDMAKILAQATMMKSIKGIGSVLGFDLSSLSLNANGGIYQSADLSRYSGTVVNRPTFFAFAKGAGVMGEAGPEAILPLRRGADGKLGVVADIGGSGMAMFAPQYNIEINNDGTNGQIGPAALKVVYDLGKKAAADFMQQQARDGGRLTESHLGKELLEKVDLTEDNASKLEQFSKEWKDANDKWNAMWGVKIEQTKDGKHYVAGIGLSMEDTEEGKLSQFLVAANRIAFIDPANGNETPMFVAQGNQIFMNDVFLKRLTAPTITSGGNPPAFSLTPDGKLTAKNADISGSVNANAGTLNNVTVNENCTIKGMLEATQVRGDFVKAVSKSFPKQAGTWGNTETPNGTVTVTISDDHNFDRQIIIPPIIFNGIAYSDPGSGNNPGGTRYTGYGFEVRKNGVLIASRETKGAIPGSYSAVIDMPSGRGSVTLEFKVFHKGNQRAGNITDCTVIVTKKAASGISIR